MPKSTISKEELEELFVNQNLSRDEIAKKFGITRTAVNYSLRKYNIFNKINDLTGKRIGSLTVVKKGLHKQHHPTYECLCDCGKIVTVRTYNLTAELPTQSCGCSRLKKTNFTGYKDIFGSYWKDLIKGAKNRNIEFAITIEQAWEIFEQQQAKCSLSGLDIAFRSQHRSEQTASLDRIDSKKGYIIGNIQWVHKDVNKLKWAFEQDYFLELCKIIYKHNYE